MDQPAPLGLDQDENGIKDFMEAGAAITSVSCPDDIVLLRDQTSVS